MLEVGTKAPAFTLSDADGKQVSLADFAGKKVVLYFYPKDNTSGCTKQAVGFAENYEQISSAGGVVVGISRDSVASHAKFRDKYELPFVLLSDPDRMAIEAYGVWQEKKMCGRVSMGIVRTTFIIDESGVIEHIYSSVKGNAEHACQVSAEYFGS